MADDRTAIKEWASLRRKPQPLKTFTQPSTFTRGEPSLPRAFLYCTAGKAPDSPQAQRATRFKADSVWRYFELNTGHNLNYSAPEETVQILDTLARG